MQLGLFTDSVSDMSFERALDFAAEIGVEAIEIATGGQSPAPHARLEQLLADDRAREAFQRAFDERGLRLEALNCSAWPLHPRKDSAHQTLIRDTIALASLLGLRKLVTMSGCPGDGADDSFVNWVWYPWPEEAVALRERQWDAAVELWSSLAEAATSAGVERIALELHPLHLVYNVPTLQRLREAVGPAIGANVDPSHMFWQQMDPVAVVSALGDAVYHVHLKDSDVVPDQAALAGVLDGRSFENPRARAWVFRTIGRAHGRDFWSRFLGALADVGYDGSLSIENEDVEQPHEAGVREAASFIRPLLAEAAHAVSS